MLSLWTVAADDKGMQVLLLAALYLNLIHLPIVVKTIIKSRQHKQIHTHEHTLVYMGCLGHYYLEFAV